MDRRGAFHLGELFALRPAAYLRLTPGRETFRWEARGGAVVVKRARGSPFGEALRELARGGPVRSAARREAENLRELAAAGFPVPRVLGWCAEAGAGLRPGSRSALVLSLVPHRETLRQRLARCGDDERARWSERVARLVARLHDAGWYHRDLYLDHLVPVAGAREAGGADGESLCLLDVGRARRERAPRRRWLVKDLAALQHSAPRTVGRTDRLRFLCRYLELRGSGGAGELRRWARQVLRKARRMAAHAPRHPDRDGRGPGGARGEELVG